MWIRHQLSSVDPLESLFLLDEEDDVGDGGGEDGGDQRPVHREVAAGGEGGHAVQLPDQVLVLLQQCCSKSWKRSLEKFEVSQSRREKAPT